MPARTCLLLALVGLQAGCGGGSGAATPATAAAPAASAGVCGYTAYPGSRLPSDAAQVLPGHRVSLGTRALAGGGFSTLAVLDVPFEPAFDAIVDRGQARGWALKGHERESADAEMLLTRGKRWLSIELNRLAGCEATRVSVYYSPLR